MGPNGPEWANLAVYGPKVLFLVGVSKRFGIHIIVFWLGIGSNGPKKPIFGQKCPFWAKFGRFWAKGAGASEAGGQTKEGALSKRYFQTSEIAQNRTKSPVPIVIDVFGVPAPYGNPYGSKIAIIFLAKSRPNGT